ncbi:hypothetical protein [Streptomyces sp. NPDC052127]|uniref:hypothetical protein n=1 Tax=Streptomyces sp. NPDC052127 TaxID=3155679 RepID=UPI00341DB602
MTTPSDDAAGPEPVPVPVRIVLPADPLLGTEQQEIVARLWKRRQRETGWLYLVGLPSYRDLENAERAVASVDALLKQEPHLQRSVPGCVRPSASPRHWPQAHPVAG